MDSTTLSQKASDTLFTMLSNVSSLKSLNLSNVNLTLSAPENDKGEEPNLNAQLVGLLSAKNCRLVSLSLTRNNLGLQACLIICQGLILNSAVAHPLKKLDVSRNKFGAKGAKLLGDSLRDNVSLHILNISFNDIGDEGAHGLAKLLQA